RDAEQRRERGDDEDVSGACEHAGEDVATEGVRPEEILAARRGELREGLAEGGVRRDEAAGERAEDPEAPDERTRDQRLRPDELHERLAPGDLELGARGGDGDGAHGVTTRSFCRGLSPLTPPPRSGYAG